MSYLVKEYQGEGITVASGPGSVLPLLADLAKEPQEQFVALYLDGANKVMKRRIVTVGLVNRSQVHPREVFADAIADRCVSVIVAHNHPSGETKPSSCDDSVTEKLKKAAEILDIKLLDHIIFTNTEKYYSYQEDGKL